MAFPILRPAAIALGIALAAPAVWAQTPPPPKAGASAARPAMPMQADMDKQFKAMQEMHEKMAAAKTPAERQALMADHMKVMREGMAMMGRMGGMGMGPGGMGQGPKGGAGPQGMMEQRMRMMEHMMQMMMDRVEAAPPAK